MLQIHVPSFEELIGEQPLNGETLSLQKEMLKKQCFEWFCLQAKNSTVKVQQNTYA